MVHVAAITSNLLAGVSLAVAVGSATVATMARRDSRRSADAAAQTAAIEQRREHDRLTPHLAITSQPDGFERHQVTVKLTGQTGLGYFDRVVVTILNTRTPAPNRIGLSWLVIDRNIWGPWKFDTQVKGSDATGRTWRQAGFGREDELRLPVVPTMPPSGWPTADPSTPRWRRGYAGAPVRLRVELEREGYPPWTLRHEVALPSLA